MLAMAIFVGLLICDPFLTHLSNGVMLPAFLMLGMVLMYFRFRQTFKERNKLP